MATLTKEDLDKPFIPKECKDCEYLLLSYASGLTRPNDKLPVATCKLNHANEIDDALRGTYVPCLDVILLNQIYYKCKYDKERLA
jgi:hypothetical protein